MASLTINLKDSFYSATVHKKHQQFLKYFEEQYLKFVYMPNSCKQAVWVFTKTSEITFSSLREKDLPKIMNTIEIFKHDEFTIHPDKS